MQIEMIKAFQLYRLVLPGLQQKMFLEFQLLHLPAGNSEDRKACKFSSSSLIFKNFFKNQNKANSGMFPRVSRVALTDVEESRGGWVTLHSPQTANKKIYYSTIMSFYQIMSRERAKYEAVIHCSVLV